MMMMMGKEASPERLVDPSDDGQHEQSMFFTGVFTRPFRKGNSSSDRESYSEESSTCEEFADAVEEKYYQQLREGCGNCNCTNLYCASNTKGKDWKKASHLTALKMARKLANSTSANGHYFCVGVINVDKSRTGSTDTMPSSHGKTYSAGSSDSLSQGGILINESEMSFHEVIGKGTFGTVFRGTWLGTEVALKKLEHHDPSAVKMSKREISLLQAVRHPNIIQFMGVIHHSDGAVYLVTEYMPRGNLFKMLRSKVDISFKTRVQWAYDVARALSYLHRLNIIHRDLKSLNLLLDAQYHVKLCDFGLARLVDSHARRNMTMCGTENWKAPEIILRRSYSTKADVFSFGIILVELMTRKTRVDRTSNLGVDFKRVSILPDCDECLVDIAKECLAVDENDRPDMGGVSSGLLEIKSSLAHSETASDLYRTAAELTPKPRGSRPKTPDSSSLSSPVRTYSSDLSTDSESIMKTNPAQRAFIRYRSTQDENSCPSAMMTSFVTRGARKHLSALSTGHSTGRVVTPLTGSNHLDMGLELELDANLENVLRQSAKKKHFKDGPAVAKLVETIKEAQIEVLRNYEHREKNTAPRTPLLPRKIQRQVQNSSFVSPSKFQFIDRMRSMLSRGDTFVKYGKFGKAKVRQVYCVLTDRRIYWKDIEANNGKKKNSMLFKDMRRVVKGHGTEIFIKKGNVERGNLAFSIVGQTKTLDLECATERDRDQWLQAFRFLLKWQGTPSNPGAVHVDES